MARLPGQHRHERPGYTHPRRSQYLLRHATLNSGITNIASAQSLGNQNSLGTNTLILNGGTLQIGGTGIVFNQFRGVNLLSGSTIDTNGNSLEIDGSIYGSGDLNKSGEGDLFLNQTNTLVGNTYSGNTVISAGSTPSATPRRSAIPPGPPPCWMPLRSSFRAQGTTTSPARSFS